MDSHIDSTPVEEVPEVQTRFAQTASDMNKILDSSANRDRARFSAPFQDQRPPPSDGGRVFADPLPTGHPSMQYGGQYAVPHREFQRRDEACFIPPVGFSQGSTQSYGQTGWSGNGIPWQTHPALQQFDNHAFLQMQQRIQQLEQRSMDVGELNKGY